jgi:NADPH:quinone reductase-like Zn-dependent oxidoreductase
MRAIVYTNYGPPDVLKLQDVPTPIPQNNEILVRVRANSINYGDLVARNFGAVTPADFNMPGPLWLLARIAFGWRRPRVTTLGSEFAGEVAAVGAAVARFQPGDQVFGYLGQRMGANAEYICMPEGGMVTHKPSTMSYAEAAAVPYGALTAMTLLRKVEIGPGRRLLIIGASGGIGAAAVQLAKHAGASVTGVCGTQRVAFVRELGADHVIDYTREALGAAGGDYDVIVDILGRSSFAACRELLTPDGCYLRVSFKLRELFQMAWTALRGGQRVICALSNETPAELEAIRQLAESGVIRSVIDRRYPLEQTAEAHRYLESGARRGPVVVEPT